MRAGRLHVPFAPLLLGLSLWAALPPLEWCPFRWDACAASCTDAEVIACGTPLAACEPAAAEAAGSACARACPADAAPAGATGACDPSPDPIPLGDRAYCVHPPLEGLLAAGIALDPPYASALPATLAPAIALEPPPFESTPTTAGPFRPPPLADPHAPPLARAPPVS